MSTTIGLLGCDAVYFDRWEQNFQTNLLQQVPSEASTYLPNYTASYFNLHVYVSTQNNQ
jgi:hypothetical protein